jgi:FkbM family methyltransferase
MKMTSVASRTLRKLTNLRLIDRRKLYLLHEQVHLERMFEAFAVDCVFDVGANTGQYAAMIRNHANYAGPIVSFEPNPEAVAHLRINAQRDRNWFVEELALGTSAGRTTLNVTASNQMSSLHQPQITETNLFETTAKVVQAIEVRMSTLEIELLKYKKMLGFRRPFLKMDTQGHDLDVASGAGEQLQEFVGLQSELAIKRVYADTPRFGDAIQFYEDRGFILSALVPNNAGHFPYLIETDCIMIRKWTRAQTTL